MASVRGGGARRSNDPVIRDFEPSSDWTEDSNAHYLLVDLPDFKKEEVNLQVDTSGNLTLGGERQTSDNRFIYRFLKTITLPPNSDMDGITGKFDSGILYVTVPKLTVKQPQQQEIEEIQKNGDKSVEEHKEDHHENDKEEKKELKSKIDGFPEETLREWQKETCQLDVAVRILKQNKQIVFTALVAFSLGVWIAHKLGSGEGHVGGSDV